MKRHPSKPRTDWQKKVESVGLTYHTAEGVPYWDESAYYSFSSAEIDDLEAATATLHELCVSAAEHIIQKNLLDRLAIPPAFHDLITDSWERDDLSLYGRFDLAYDGQNAPKLLEYNADTPTSLIETGVAQWFWLQDTFPKKDQFNSIHEKLIAAWKFIAGKLGKHAIHFGCLKEHEEDLRTVEYLMDTAMQAGVPAKLIFIEDIGWKKPEFYDMTDHQINTLFKLYPWEWLIHEQFGKYLLLEPCSLIEPAWKMLWSNKGILPILWELFPSHPNLLPAFTTPDAMGLHNRYAKKPLLSREGANITLQSGSQTLAATQGEYGEEGFIYQALADIPEFDGNYPVLGSWVVGGEPAGIGIREDIQPVTGNTSRFVPHFFE
jgi:glutathionylspermidine synthase